MHRLLLLTLWLAVVSLSLSSRYHAVVDSGRPGEGPLLEYPWAASFLGGLVPPSTPTLSAKCPQGFARVETSLSLANLAVTALTLGFYSPMTVRVTCAAPSERRNSSRIETAHCSADPLGEAVVLLEHREARFHFAEEPDRTWDWATERDAMNGSRTHAWQVEVESGGERFTAGYSFWYFDSRQPGRGSLAALIEAGQASVWERMNARLIEGVPPGILPDIPGAEVSRDLRVDVFARNDTVHVVIRDPDTFTRLFSTRPTTVTMVRSVAGEDRETRVPLSYISEPRCARQVLWPRDP